MIWIVSGPSSVGKSTFINSNRCREITGLPADAPLLIPANERAITAESLMLPMDNCFFHYNLLRPADRTAKISSTEIRARSVLFSDDPRWATFLRNSAPTRALILVANREAILKRLGRRNIIEPSLKTCTRNTYDTSYWQNLYKNVDLLAIYSAWTAELDRNLISYSFIDASDYAYREIDAYRAFARCEGQSTG